MSGRRPQPKQELPTWALTPDRMKAVNLYTGMVLEVSGYEEFSTGLMRYALWVYNLTNPGQRLELSPGYSDRACINEMHRLIGLEGILP